MKVVKTKVGYVIKHNESNVKIDGITEFAVMTQLEEALKQRGYGVQSSGDVVPLAQLEDSPKNMPKEPAAPKKKEPALKLKSGKGPGRPRIYTPEEAKERRRAQNREAARRAREKNPDKVAERARKYREDHPDKVSEYRKTSYEKRKQRMAEDPEFRAQFNAYQREYRARKRAEKKEQ